MILFSTLIANRLRIGCHDPISTLCSLQFIFNFTTFYILLIHLNLIFNLCLLWAEHPKRFSFLFSQSQPWELENMSVCPELDTCLCVALDKPLNFSRLQASLLLRAIESGYWGEKKIPRDWGGGGSSVRLLSWRLPLEWAIFICSLFCLLKRWS